MKFYVGDTLFHIHDLGEFDFLNLAKGQFYKKADNNSIMEVYQQVKDSKHLNFDVIHFETPDYKKTCEKLSKKHFKVIVAAGGLIENEGKILFIFRNGKWDLPKGKAEKGESAEETALREVFEECGVKVKINSLLANIWHTYPHKNKEILKCTIWYKMQSLDNSEQSPQHEEGIEKIEWLSLEQIPEKIYPNTYASIIETLKIYLDKKTSN